MMTTLELAKTEFSDIPKMSFAELLPIVQALPQPEKLQLIEMLQDDVLEDITQLMMRHLKLLTTYFYFYKSVNNQCFSRKQNVKIFMRTYLSLIGIYSSLKL